MKPPFAARQIARFVFCLLLLAASDADAFELTDGSTTSPLRLEVSTQVFARSRSRRADGGSFRTQAGLQRARVELTLYYKDLIKAQVEPDFAGDQADLADVYFAVRPTDGFDVLVGQAKAPFGEVETLGRFELPVLRRGVITDTVFDRLGISRRRVGVRARLKLRDVSLKPVFELGAYTDQLDDLAVDGAARVEVRPASGLRIKLAGYAKNNALSDGGHGTFGALSATYVKKRWFAVAEIIAGRARLLRRDGVDSGVDSTWMGARALLGYRLKLSREVDLVPGVGVDVLDPNAATRDDLAVDVRGDLGVLFWDRFRLAVEFARQATQDGFPEGSRTTVTALAGVKLE